jgi:SAM-dependent methyltransferase
VISREYDDWYRTPRGAWIGEVEYRLLARMLAARPGASVLDVGCGTGYFSRRLAQSGHCVLGVDIDAAAIEYARAHSVGSDQYQVGDATRLAFQDSTFEWCVSVTALCFVRDERKAMTEMARVARHGITIGLLNRHSLLFAQKGRRGGTGAYRGARWHTPEEARELFDGLPLSAPAVRTAVFLPSGGSAARRIESLLSNRIPLGAFLAASATRIPPSASDRQV